MEFNLADLFESAAAEVPDAEEELVGERRPDDRWATAVASGQP